MATHGFTSAEGRPAPVVWLEAEQFREPGGWVHDSQFIPLVGSSYLLANSLGRPVEDAVTTAQVLISGSYRLWVRCRDWLPGHSPGRFQVLVDGRPAPVIFGQAETDAWQWVDGGTVALAAGAVEVRLHDLTGWWGRCDAVVLTLGEQPSDDPDTLAQQRARYGGVSAAVTPKGPYDLVVVGGGLAGCTAAVAAARHGCRVALIHDRPVLGGNASSEIRVGPSGDTSREPLDPGETGILEEFQPPRGGDWSTHCEAVVRAEERIDLFLDRCATGVTIAGPQAIASVLATHTYTGERLEIAGRLFVDATGDGWLGYWAGADYRHGREGRADFDEPAAPEQADPYTLSTSLTRCQIVTHDQPAPFQAPEWVPTWKSCDDFDPLPKETVHSRGDLPPEGWHSFEPGEGRHPDRADAIRGAWWLELGGTRDTLRDAERIRDDLLRLKLGLWDHLKNHCREYRAENATRELVWHSHIAGKRESRRLLGDYVLSQRDYMARATHPDSVLYAGYNIDPHHPLGFWKKGPQAFRLYHYKVSVPYRILYSRNIENLFMAGRNVSATHLAMNGVRVMRTTAMMGQVVGTAAGIARRYETTPRGVYQQHIRELQQTLLRDGCYLIGIRNEDADDLARHARVTASSHAVIADPRDPAASVVLRAENVVNGWNRAVQGEPNSWGPDPGQPGPHWIELRFEREVALSEVQVTFQLPGEMTAAAYGLLVPGGDGWHTVCSVRDNKRRRRVHRLDGVRGDRLRLTLVGDAAETGKARLAEVRVYG